MMIVNITSKQMEITEAIRQHVEERLAKLEKWQTDLINPHIVLSKEPKDFVNNQCFKMCHALGT